MTTLADLTPEERAEYRGTWCEDTSGALCIYMGDARGLGVGAYPASRCVMSSFLDELTPRPGLPRAWNPDGTPPAGQWEDDYTDSDGSTLTTGEDLGIGPHQEIRRWIGEWEEQ